MRKLQHEYSYEAPFTSSRLIDFLLHAKRLRRRRQRTKFVPSSIDLLNLASSVQRSSNVVWYNLRDFGGTNNLFHHLSSNDTKAADLNFSPCQTCYWCICFRLSFQSSATTDFSSFLTRGYSWPICCRSTVKFATLLNHCGLYEYPECTWSIVCVLQKWIRKFKKVMRTRGFRRHDRGPISKFEINFLEKKSKFKC